MLDEELLEAYIETYFGYGNYQAPYWFIGMEPGGELTLEGMQTRLMTWDEKGRPELEALGHYPKGIQPTWGGLIKIQFAIQGVEATTGTVRAYQQKHWGKLDSPTCLVELLPLPSPSAHKWVYGSYSQLPQLRSRGAYVMKYAISRATHLKMRVREHKPEVVVLYGSKYLDWWTVVAGTPLELTRVGGEKVHLATNRGTLFVAINHVTAMGTRDEYLEELGRMIAGSLAGGVGAT